MRLCAPDRALTAAMAREGVATVMTGLGADDREDEFDGSAVGDRPNSGTSVNLFLGMSGRAAFHG